MLLLQQHRRDERVSRIYYLYLSKGLQPLSKKVQFLDADFSKPYFGLPIIIFKELLDRTTHVIHNAWQVDFNLFIHSFTRHISFVRRLIDFSSHSRLGAEIFFISCISAVSGLQGTVTEQIYTDWATPTTSGYGQSKFLSERLLDVAAREADIPSAICRLGQVAGPTSTAGEWSKKEWLPSLIASSKYLGKIPDSLGPRLDTIDWIPVDKLGKVIVELAIRPARSHQPNTSASVYHAINPHHTTWGELLPIVSRRLNQGKEVVEVVSLEAWTDALRDSASKTDNIAANPAIKLLDFFESLVDTGATSLSTESTVQISPTLSTIGPVKDDWMDNWLTQWGF
ncbi:NAD(P)-binding protein [Xylaria cubensis]|nr:NAD(P)-binding protein [Xylaria cubensis]